MELLVLVSLDLHDASASHYVDKAYTTIVCCDHRDILIKEVDSSHFSAAGEFSIVVFDINRSLKLESLYVALLLRRVWM